LLLSLSLAACAAGSSPAEAPPASAPSVAPAPANDRPLVWIEDDVPGAVAKAKAEHKVLFVDAWAPWCHTCLSMKNFVLGDPALRPLAELAVFVALDFDKPENAAFVAKHGVHVLPTYFVLDPARDEVVGTWLGSGTARELRAMVELAAGGAEDASPASPSAKAKDAYRKACRARAKGDKAATAAEFAIAVDQAPPDFALKSEAILGLMSADAALERYDACVNVATRWGGEVRGSSIPSDFAITLLECAEKLPADQRAKPRAEAIQRLRAFIDHPPEGASVDDRGDAASSLAAALEDGGDAAGAKAVREAWLAMLDEAQKKAGNVEVAHTFDYQRANALMALGRAPEAVTMLEARVKQMPDSYEPVSRLASALLRAGRLPEALVASRRAVELAYGTRKLRYLATESKILGKLGDQKAQVELLEREVAGWKALPPDQASPASLADAEKRLEEARRPAAPSKPAR
jgi:tetratricopeptide (TPR) repeat protein